MEYTAKTDYVEEGISRLLDQFRKYQDSQNLATPNIPPFLSVFTDKLQELENVIYDVYFYSKLPNAYGKTLEYIGNSVGQARPSYGLALTDDNAYRSLIYAKIASNISNGTKPEILDIITLLGATNSIMYENYPASLQLNLFGNLLLSITDIKNVIINSTLPIELDVSEYYTQPFGFNNNQSSGFGIGRLGGAI